MAVVILARLWVRQMKTGRDLDRLVHKLVFGKSTDAPIPSYSTMTNAAFHIVEHLRDKGEGMAMVFGVHPNRNTDVCMWNDEGDEVHTCADTTPLAICLAALKAVGYKEPHA